MAARVCAHRATVPVALGDFGDFELVVRRVSIDERAEIQELNELLLKKRPKASEADLAASKMRSQLQSMVQSVSGVEFEWAPDDVSAPETIDALLADLERFEPLSIRESIGTLWAHCVEAQFLSPFSARPSKPGPAS